MADLDKPKIRLPDLRCQVCRLPLGCDLWWEDGKPTYRVTPHTCPRISTGEVPYIAREEINQ